MNRLGGLHVLAVGAALTLLAVPPSVGDDETTPLTNEAVVRMLVQGVPSPEIERAIRARPARFDLSPEMLEELRIAGLSERILQAMRERQAQAQESASDPAPAASTEDGFEPREALKLRVVLNPQRKPERVDTLRLSGRVSLELREAWQLDARLEGRPFQDLAIYLACVSSRHVSDHWRGKSPLGRDYDSMPRHSMLAFVSGAERNAEALELEVPPSIDVELAPDDPHDLMLGIAVEVGGRFYRVADDAWEALVLHDRDLELRAKLVDGVGGQLDGLAVRFDRTPSPGSPSE